MLRTMPGKAPLTSVTDRPIRHLFQDTYTLYRRAFLRMFRVPAQLYFSLVQPLVWFILFGQLFSRLTTGFGAAGANNPLTAQFGTSNYSAFFLPAIIIQVLLFGSANAALAVINDDQSGYLNKLRMAPINRFAILMGTILADLTRILVQVLILLIVGLIFGVRFAHWELIPFIFVIAFLFSLVVGGFGLYIGLTTRSAQMTILVINFFTLPLLLISSAQLPITLLPDWLQVIARFNPVTYGIDSIRVIVTGLNTQQISEGQNVWSILLLGMGILFVLAFIAMAAATYRFRKQIQ